MVAHCVCKHASQGRAIGELIEGRASWHGARAGVSEETFCFYSRGHQEPTTGNGQYLARVRNSHSGRFRTAVHEGRDPSWLEMDSGLRVTNAYLLMRIAITNSCNKKSIFQLCFPQAIDHMENHVYGSTGNTGIDQF